MIVRRVVQHFRSLHRTTNVFKICKQRDRRGHGVSPHHVRVDEDSRCAITSRRFARTARRRFARPHRPRNQEISNCRPVFELIRTTSRLELPRLGISDVCMYVRLRGRDSFATNAMTAERDPDMNARRREIDAVKVTALVKSKQASIRVKSHVIQPKPIS